MKEAKPSPSVDLLPAWIAYPCAFVAFVLAGYQAANADRELYESMNVELPYLTQIQLDYATSIGVGAVIVGLALLALTRARARRSWSFALRPVALAASALTGTTAVLFLYASALVFRHMCQTLGQ